LLKSSPWIHSEYTTTEADRGFVKRLEDLRQRFRGWRFGVLLASAMSSLVLLTNCVAAIAIHAAYGTHDGVITAFEGDCDIVNRWSLGLHLVINVLSSLLLSASNYTMQVLNAPTRSECDKAHARGVWMDIGITSLHNIAKIAWPRRVLWLLLGFSSVPVDLFYNSAAFKTIGSNEYVVVVATPRYLQGDAVPPPRWNLSGPWSLVGSADYHAEVLRQTYQSPKLEFANLTNTECINTYGVDFMTGHSDVIAVISGPYPSSASIGAWSRSEPKLDWQYSKSYSWYVFLAQRMVAYAYECVTMEALLFHFDSDTTRDQTLITS
jgi:hypothetical protein